MGFFLWATYTSNTYVLWAPEKKVYVKNIKITTNKKRWKNSLFIVLSISLPSAQWKKNIIHNIHLPNEKKSFDESIFKLTLSHKAAFCTS